MAIDSNEREQGSGAGKGTASETLKALRPMSDRLKALLIEEMGLSDDGPSFIFVFDHADILEHGGRALPVLGAFEQDYKQDLDEERCAPDRREPLVALRSAAYCCFENRLYVWDGVRCKWVGRTC